jgi:ABC-2 type transport system ATP-binding protein
MSGVLPEPAPPVLRARAARIAVAGTTAMAALDLTTRGERVLLIGASLPLVAALAGTTAAGAPAEVVAGSLELCGADVGRGEHRRRAGVALPDAPLPPRFKPLELLAWCARLAGIPRREAAPRAAAALERLGLGALASRRLRSLSTLERRALAIAAAVVHEPVVLVVDNPLELLDDADAWSLLGVLSRASEGRAAIVALPRLLGLSDPAAQLARTASDICLLRDGELLFHAPPSVLLAGMPLLQLTVEEGAEALREALAARGLDLAGGPRHFALRLEDGITVNDVLSAAAEVRAAVVACVPLL